MLTAKELILIEILEEASEELCPHEDKAKEMVLKHGMRGRCGFCQSYLRSKKDVTLYDRVQHILTVMKGT